MGVDDSKDFYMECEECLYEATRNMLRNLRAKEWLRLAA